MLNKISDTDSDSALMYTMYRCTETGVHDSFVLWQ